MMQNVPNPETSKEKHFMDTLAMSTIELARENDQREGGTLFVGRCEVIGKSPGRYYPIEPYRKHSRLLS